MLKCDFHIHTNNSKDSNMPPEIVVKTAVKKGLDVICVLDHNILKGGLEAKKIAEKKAPKLLVIPGEEVKTTHGELILMNLKKTIPRGLSLEKTIVEARKQGAFIIAPHPFDRMRQGVGDEIDKIADKIDAIEAFNARSLYPKCNEKAMRYAKEKKIPYVGGSDSHFFYEIGSGYTLVDAEKSTKTVFEAIKNGKVKIRGKKTGLWPHIGTFFQKKLGKKYRKLPFTGSSFE